MKLVFPDDSAREFPEDTTGEVVLRSLSERLSRKALAISLNGSLFDLNTPLPTGGVFSAVTPDTPEGVHLLRHSSAHVMALAVQRLFPHVLFGFGPAIEDGFYYDFDALEIAEKDFPCIEEEMLKIRKEKLPFSRVVLSRDEALALFCTQLYKIELLEGLSTEETITCYRVGKFADLCRGPHIPHTGHLAACRLLRTAGAYWKGDASRKMLKRIYAAAFPSQKELARYLALRREAEENDHVKLGRELDLFVTDHNVGKGLPLLTPRGTTIKRVLQRFVEDEEFKRGYAHTMTPLMASEKLYRISGHWDLYKDLMFTLPIEGEDLEMALRPMTCPFHFSLYNRHQHSYRDLPVRYAETSTLFRKEASGALHGLLRIYQFTIADAHIICRPEQLEEEFQSSLSLANHILKTLRITDYSYRFSKWDPRDKGKKYIDNPAAWEKSQKILKRSIDKTGIAYTESEGEAAFYGPKLDIQTKNVWGKEDTLITIQVDFALAERFRMTYRDQQGDEQRPLIIHRTSLGCYERTIALLIERYKGKFPFWIAPRQIQLVTINDSLLPQAERLDARFRQEGLRSAVDTRGETLRKKIRSAHLARVPMAITIGEKEVASDSVSVRTLDGKLHQGIPTERFIALCKELDASRSDSFSFS